MIILFDESTNKFDNLGLGVLKDAIDCTVKESLNNTFELEMNRKTVIYKTKSI